MSQIWLPPGAHSVVISSRNGVLIIQIIIRIVTEIRVERLRRELKLPRAKVRLFNKLKTIINKGHNSKKMVEPIFIN